MSGPSRRQVLQAGTLASVAGLAGCGYRTEASFLALGDSYTVGTGVQPDERWSTRLVDRLRERDIYLGEPTVIARNGWTTDELDAALDRETPRGDNDLLTLCIGVNDAFQGRPADTFRPRFEGLLERTIDLGDGTPRNVLVLTIPDYTVTPVGQRHEPEAHRKRLEAYNEILEAEARTRDAGLVDLVEPSRKAAENSDLVADDGLHPSAEQHGLWLDRIEPVAAEILED